MSTDSDVAQPRSGPSQNSVQTHEHVDVLVVAAMGLELEPLRLRLQSRRTERGRFRVDVGELSKVRVALVESGPGQKNAVAALEAALGAYPSSSVCAIGIGGGLVDSLHVGDVVFATGVVRQPSRGDQQESLAKSATGLHADSGRSISISSGVSCEGKSRQSEGVLLTVDEPILSEAAKREAHERTGAVVVDMETHALAEWCAVQKQRLIAARAVSDAVADSLPEVVRHLVGSGPIEQVGRVAGTLFRQPSVVKELWTLRSRALEAADRLGEVMADVIASMRSPKS